MFLPDASSPFSIIFPWQLRKQKKATGEKSKTNGPCITAGGNKFVAKIYDFLQCCGLSTMNSYVVIAIVNKSYIP